MRKSEVFRNFLNNKEIIQLPGCYDAIGAKMIEKSGFRAAYVTGSGVSLSILGHPDINTVSYFELYQRVNQIVSAISIPVLVDIDTGFGGPLNIIRLVKDFEKIDVAAVQIEDQISPKRCGHEKGRQVVSCQEMIERVKAIVENRGENGLCIVARTDSLSLYGVDEAINRANQYIKAGADIVFVESPENLNDIKRLCSEINGPKLFNYVEGGKTPLLDKNELKELGYKFVIYPNSLTRITIKKITELLEEIRKIGSTEGMSQQMVNHVELWEYFGSEKFYDLEARYMKR